MEQLLVLQVVKLAGWPWVWLGLAATLLLLVYPAIVIRKYIRILINVLDDQSPSTDNGNGNGHADDNGNGNGESILYAGEKVRFRAVDGHLLEGAVLSGRKDGPKRGMIIFAHEVGSDRRSGIRYCRSLLKAGFDVFLFDFRGHGLSAPEEGYRPRQWPTDREQADMLGAIAFMGSYLEQHDLSPNVGLFGLSRGGCAAILASVGMDCVKAIVADGAFSSDTTLEYLMKRFATIFARIRIVAENHPPPVWRFMRWLAFRECRRRYRCRFPSVRKALVRLGRKPILFIHGEKDSYIPIAQPQALYDLAAGPKYLWIVPCARHNQSILVAPEEYGRRVVRFFQEHLADERTIDEPAMNHTMPSVGEVRTVQPKNLGMMARTMAESAPAE